VELGKVRTGLHTEATVCGDSFPEASDYGPLYERVPAAAAELQSKAMPVDDAVLRIYDALTAESPKPVVLVGRDARIRAALSRIAPSVFDRIILKKLDWLPR
jgi:hypothetical protein